MSQTERLITIEARAAAASPHLLIADENGFALAAPAVDGMGTEIIAHFTPACGYAERELLVHAVEDVRFLLELVRRAVVKVRSLEAQLPRAKDYATECSMKCQEPAFKKWLEEAHSLERPLTDERVATKVRGLLNIRSRRELNTDSNAAGRWKRMRSDFENWKRTGK